MQCSWSLCCILFSGGTKDAFWPGTLVKLSIKATTFEPLGFYNSLMSCKNVQLTLILTKSNSEYTLSSHWLCHIVICYSIYILFLGCSRCSLTDAGQLGFHCVQFVVFISHMIMLLWVCTVNYHVYIIPNIIGLREKICCIVLPQNKGGQL